jgi:threonine synthase
MHTSLNCAACGKSHDVDRLQNLCTDCGKPLLVGYDLAAVAETFRPDVVRLRTERSMWRFREVMPIADDAEIVSLGEGCTPLLPLERRGPFAPFTQLYVKDEAFNPTGSFKARGMSAAITRAKALGAKVVALPSAGNAAGAATYYAAKAGMPCYLFMPADTPPANIVESVVGGANVFLVNGLISDCGKLVRQGCERFGWFDLSTLKEPFRIEGKKTMGYELAFDFAESGRRKAESGMESGRRKAESGGQTAPLTTHHSPLTLPDVIFYPTGGGTGLIGMWKAFDEMEQLGWIGPQRPRMVVVQAEGCAPIVNAFDSGADHAEMFPDAHTIAAGLRVPAAIGDFLMLKVLRESDGTAVSVTDDELTDGVRELARYQGIYACPEAGAVWKAALQLLDIGWLDAAEQIVLFNTGSGLKYNHLFPVADLPLLDHTDPNCLDRVGT